MQDTKDVSVFILLFQIQHLSRYHAMKRLEELELKPGQAGILFTLNVEGVLSQRQLAEKIGITPPSMTVALRKLEERGYVLKEPDGRDQRIIRIRLSEKGEKMCRRPEEGYGRYGRDYLSGNVPGGETAAEAPASGNAKESDGFERL